MKPLTARLEAVASLVPEARVIVDIGADHGLLAAHLDAIAVERMPHRRGRAPARWLIADGLSALLEVDVAVIAGVGARTAARLLSQVCPVRVAIVAQPPDDPGYLRMWGASAGWRIDAERLATHRGRLYETTRWVPGVETATGLLLEYGPLLVAGDDPLREIWLGERLAYARRLELTLREVAPARAAEASRRVAFLEAATRLRDRPQPPT